MLNRFNSIVLILLISLSVCYGQCDDCPGSIEAPPSVGSISSQFNGFTSEVNIYDGDNPDCYMPVSNSLNGHLEGIDNQICELNELLDSLKIVCVDTSQLNDLISLIDGLETSYTALKQTLVTSLDNSITVTTTTSADTVSYDLAVNYEVIGDSLLAGVDGSCIDSVTSISQVLSDLLNMNCDTTSFYYSKGCLPDTALTAQLVANVTSLPASLTFTVTPSFIQTFPTWLCIKSIAYIYKVYDTDGDIIEGGDGIVYGTKTLNVPYLFSVATSYGDGARTAQITMVLQREVCANGAYCPYSTVTSSTLAISAP